MAATSTHPLPSAFLLDEEVHVVEGHNATMAVARAVTFRSAAAVDVTLDITNSSEPLPVATVLIHCPDASTRLLTAPAPRVVGAEGPYILISARFEWGNEFVGGTGDELFLYDYEAGYLQNIVPPPSILKYVKSFAVLPRGRGGEFLLAAIGYVGQSFDQGMHVLCSEDQSWATKPIDNPPWRPTFLDKVTPSKAIAVGEKQALWVDMDRGVIILSDLSSDPPLMQYIPVPSDAAVPKLEKLISPTFSLGMCRDVTVAADGVIKFIQIQNRVALTYKQQDATEGPSVKDTDLISKKRPHLDPDLVFSVSGWRLETWSRTIDADAWSREEVVDVEDMDITAQSANEVTYQKMYCLLPTIIADTVYFNAVAKVGDQTGYLVSVDIRDKALKTFAPLPSPSPTDRAYRPHLRKDVESA